MKIKHHLVTIESFCKVNKELRGHIFKQLHLVHVSLMQELDSLTCLCYGHRNRC
jgi:hypothetical protein